MPERTFTQLDYVRLTRLMTLSTELAPDAARAMEDAPASGELVALPQVPPTVATMYSQVRAQEEGAAPRKLTLCYPEHAEPAAGFISVLSPVGIDGAPVMAGLSSPCAGSPAPNCQGEGCQVVTRAAPAVRSRQSRHRLFGWLS